jgi:DnaJ-class molecular chaperone
MVFEREDKCPDCAGTGKQITSICEKCNGQRIVEEEQIKS